MTFHQKWVRLLKAVTLTAFVAGGLAACGGGGGSAGTSVVGGGGTDGTGAAISDVAVVLSKGTMANDGTETLTLTATALDANRGGVANAKLTVAISDPNNSVFASSSSLTTDTSGASTATISLGADHTLRTVTVTVGNASVSKSATFNVIQTTTPTTTAADLSLSLDKYTVSNSGSDTVVATVTAVDANRNVLAGVPVSFSVNNGATIAVTNSTTDASGQSVASVKIGADKSNRVVTITATSNTLQRTASFQVSGAKLVASPVPSTPTAGSTGNTVLYRLSDTNDNAISGQAITVTAPGQTAVNGTTDNSGAFTYTYTAPTTPGAYNITAVSGGVTTVSTVTIPTAGTTIPTVTTAVSSATATTNPSVVAINAAGSTANRVELRALFQSAANAPIQNMRVRFELFGNASQSVGGTISSGTSLVYSDASGYATSSYYPADRASGTNGVTIRACWDYADFASTACPNALTTTLTVVSSPLSITIGTDGTLSEGDSKLTYVKRFVVLVVDASGKPSAGVDIAPLIDLTRYYKGTYVVSGASWTPFFQFGGAAQAGQWSCLNEDDDRDGLIDTGEDRNGNGRLDPRKSDVSIAFEGTSTKTDASGQLVLKMEYPKSLATWIDYTITASATGVVSPPATYSGNLSALASDFTTITASPAFRVSPYGNVRSPSDVAGSYCFSPN